MKTEIVKKDSDFLIYQDDNGITNVNVRFDGKDVWLSQQQIAILFDTTQQNVSLHINSILDEAELLQVATHKYFLLVRQEGNRSVKRQIEHYNPDMIIAIGYSVDYDPKSPISIAFFKMAQNKLHYAAHGHNAEEVIFVTNIYQK